MYRSLLVLITIACISCDQLISQSPVNDSDSAFPFQTVIKSSYDFPADLGIRESVVVLMDSAEIKPFFRTYIHSGFDTSNFDYDGHMILGLLLGYRGTASVDLTIDSIFQKDSSLHLIATEHYEVIQNDMISNPGHFVMVRKSSLPVVIDTIVHTQDSLLTL